MTAEKKLQEEYIERVRECFRSKGTKARHDVRPAVEDNTMLYIEGKVKRLKEWAEVSPVSLRTIKKRLHRGWSTRMAVRVKESTWEVEARAKAERWLELASRSLAVWVIKGVIKKLFPKVDIDDPLSADPSEDDRRQAKIILNHVMIQQKAIQEAEEWMLVISDFSEGAVVDILADPDGNVTDCANMVTIMGLFIVGRLSKEDAEAKLADRFKGHGFPLLYFTGHETFDTGEVILKRKKPPEDKSSKVEGNAA